MATEAVIQRTGRSATVMEAGDGFHSVHWEIVAVAAIAVVAGFLRFYNLPSQGLIYWDEGKFALEGVRFAALAQHLGSTTLAGLAGKPAGTAKPGHALILGLAFLVLGIHDYSPLMADALASTLTVPLTFLIARRLLGTAPALVAALLLGVSEYDVIYARSALSETDALLVFLVAVVLWLPSLDAAHGATRRLLLVGLVGGFAFTVNYRMIVYAGALVFADAVCAAARQKLRAIPGRLAILGVGFVLFPLLWQFVDTVTASHGLYLFRDELTGRPDTYLQQVAYQLHQGKQSVLHFEPVPYLQWFYVREGWGISALLGAGLLLAGLERTRSLLIPATLVVVPYVVYVFAPFYVPRNLEEALPFCCILAAAALCKLVSYLRRSQTRRTLLVALTVVVGLAEGSQTWRLTNVHSGFSLAYRYVELHGGLAIVSSEDMAFYLRDHGQCYGVAVPKRIDELPAYIAAGYRYAVTDRHGTRVTHYLNAQAPIVARYQATGTLGIGESLVGSENSHPPDGGGHPEWVTVYRLTALHVTHAATSPVFCNQNRVV